MCDLHELTESYLQSLRDGASVDVLQFADQHPQWREELLELLPALAAMEELGQNSRDATATPPVNFPAQLGEFQLWERLGSGGMGTVFRATQQSLNRSVAIKILAPTWATDDKQLAKFKNESRLIASLHHTNIVEVHGAGHDQGYSYYVMTLIDGPSLNDAQWRQVTAGQRNLNEMVAHIGLQAAEALAYAHDQGVLHLDIKPSNILLDRRGTAHLSDFGLATALNNEVISTVASQSQDGTLRYMAPERLLDNDNSPAADQYSLGLTLYELLTGQPALPTESPGKMIKRICEEGVPLLPTKSSDLAVIINKSISFLPQERYRNLADMAADLRRFLRGEPIRARSHTSLRRLQLWMYRRPAVALLTVLAAMLTILLFAAISVGYLRVKEALHTVGHERQRAEDNIRIAEATLARIFKRTLTDGDLESELPPTHVNARLLYDIMPYYERIAAEGSAPQATIAQAKKVLGIISLRSNSLPLAESILAEATTLFPKDSYDAAYCRNQQALAVFRQRRQSEACQLWQSMAADFASSSDFTCRLEAVRALRAAAWTMARPVDDSGANPNSSQRLYRRASFRGAGNRSERRSTGNAEAHITAVPTSSSDVAATSNLREQSLRFAMSILLDLHRDRPEHPDIRFLQALLLADAPDLFAEALTIDDHRMEPFAVLDRLVSEYPDNHQYRLELIRYSRKLDLREPFFTENILKMRRALRHREILLTAYPGDRGVVEAVFSLQQTYQQALFKAGQYRSANRVLHQTIGLLRLLVSQPEALPETQEKLIDLQFQQISETSRHRQTEETEDLLEDLKIMLKAYKGPKAADFKRKIDDLQRRSARERPR